MKKILIFLFFLLGALSIYMSLNVDLKCAEATMRDNFLAGLPLLSFGLYSMITALFLWKKPQIGNTLAVITITVAIIMLVFSVFDLSLPIIKASCPI